MISKVSQPSVGCRGRSFPLRWTWCSGGSPPASASGLSDAAASCSCRSWRRQTVDRPPAEGRWTWAGAGSPSPGDREDTAAPAGDISETLEQRKRLNEPKNQTGRFKLDYLSTNIHQSLKYLMIKAEMGFDWRLKPTVPREHVGVRVLQEADLQIHVVLCVEDSRSAELPPARLNSGCKRPGRQDNISWVWSRFIIKYNKQSEISRS